MILFLFLLFFIWQVGSPRMSLWFLDRIMYCVFPLLSKYILHFKHYPLAFVIVHHCIIPLYCTHPSLVLSWPFNMTSTTAGLHYYYPLVATAMLYYSRHTYLIVCRILLYCFFVAVTVVYSGHVIVLYNGIAHTVYTAMQVI